LVVLNFVLSLFRFIFFHSSRLPHVSFPLLNLFLIVFLGESEEIRNISRINWDTICSKNENGGLGVRRIHEFNLALLGKWY